MTFKPFVISFFALGLMSCSTFNTVPEQQRGTIEREVTLKNCNRTQRNLNTPWSQRSYLCGSNKYISQLKESPKFKPPSMNRGVIDRSYQLARSRKLQEKLKPVIDDSPLVVAESTPKGHPVSFTLEEFESKQSPINRPTKTSDLSVVYQVPFAPSREVLGPVGRRTTNSIYSLAKEANRVILQGVVSRKSFNSIDIMDKTSVGRSLSIRKHLRQQGVQRSKFTILHRNNQHFRPNKTDGDYVEVRFDA